MIDHTIKPDSRESDERILRWLKQRVCGLTCKQIADRDGDVSASYVRSVTSRIKRESVQ